MDPASSASVPGGQWKLKTVAEEQGISSKSAFTSGRHQTAKLNQGARFASSMIPISRAALVGAGVTLFVMVCKMGAVAFTAAAMTTPIGWAFIGLAAIGLTILVARGLYMRYHQQESHTGKEILKGGLAMGIGFAIPLAILAIGGLAMIGVNVLDVFSGGGGGGRRRGNYM